MIASTYVILTRRGVSRMTKRRPSLRSGEIAVRLNLNVSDKFFAQTMPVANIGVSEDLIQTPELKVEVHKP